ncbi:hypothetical protein EI613_08555 [Azospirillum sp. 412522]|nr:hypothetical protein [Azospirillum sp. 412522]MBY6261976.1 hypothetical protein [Azospirillum sp. 412522]
MSHSANSLFSALPTGQAGAWKPVSAAAGKSKSLVATAFSPPSAEAGDNIDVSPLGKALTGAAAKVFEKLDGKARGMLEDYVKTGVLSANDVVKGLRGIAKEAVQNRYLSEAPRTQEEIDYGEKKKSANERKLNFGMEQMNIIRSFSDKMEQADRENSGGDAVGSKKELLYKEMTSSLESHKKNFVESYGSLDEKIMKDGEEIDEDFVMRRLSNNLRHSDIFSGEEDSAVFSSTDSKAVEKLFNVGFRPAVYRNAAKAFADETDLGGIPDLERPKAEPRQKQTSMEPLPPGYSEGKAQLDAIWQAAAGMMMQVKKTGDEDPMVALLKTNATVPPTRQGYPNLQQLPIASRQDAAEDVSGTARTDTVA